MLVLTLRNLLYGLSLRRELTQAGFSRPRPSVPLLGFALTDESYGMTIAEARTRDDEEVEPDAASATPPLRLDAFLFGASLSLYVAFPMSTLAGIAFGSLLPDTDALGLEMIFPLCFLAVLLPLLRGWRTMIVALVAASLVLLLGQAMDGGTAMFLATVGAAGLGAILERGASEAQDV